MATWADEFPVTDEAQTREQLRLVGVECSSPGDHEPLVLAWLEAQRDALQWLAGDSGSAPLTGREARATRGSVSTEYGVAMVAALNDSDRDLAGARARGVDRVLRWALGMADAPMTWKASSTP